MPAVHAATVDGYDRSAQRYRDWWAPVIAPAAVAVLDRVDADADGRFTLVDVGAGAGTLALAALERWPAVRVIAVEPAAGLRALTAAEWGTRAPGDERLEVVDGSGSRLPLPDESVDVVASSFVIQLVPSRMAMLREARRILRSGGTFACVTWQSDDAPFQPDDVFNEVVDELDIELPPPGRDPRPYPSPAAATAELRRAGFSDVQATVEWLEHRYTPESYVDLLEHWAEDELFERLDDETRDRLRGRLLGGLRALRPEALAWRRPLVSAVGRRP